MDEDFNPSQAHEYEVQRRTKEFLENQKQGSKVKNEQ